MKFIMSACLAGLPCRYDGKSKPVQKLVELHESGQAALVCPESLSGLPTPRLPGEQRGGRVFLKDGRDVTDNFELGAEAALRKVLQTGCKRAILKARSPSCGVGVIYDGSFTGKTCSGNGVFAQKLLAAGFEITDEEHLEKFGIARK